MNILSRINKICVDTVKCSAGALALLSLMSPAIASARSVPDTAGPTYNITKTVSLPGTEKWDFLLYSPLHKRVYVAHGDHVAVVDEPAAKLIDQMGPFPGGTHGIAVAPDSRQGFISSGEPGSAIAFGLDTLKPTRTIKAAADADGIVYDPFSKHIFVVNGDSGSVTVIDPANDHPITTINVGAKLEPGVPDGLGHLYLNGEARNEIVVVDTKTNSVVAHWPMPACQTPHGIAMDRSSRRIFSTCANKVLVAVNADTGATVATVPIGGHSDGAAFDPVRNLVFSANGDGTLSVIKEASPDHLIPLETVPTQKSARTISIDPKTGRLFVVAATVVSEQPPAEKGGRPHVTYAPDSVSLLYLDPGR